MGRRIIGITGPPGAGKTTYARQTVAALGAAAHVPMDGFHLADVRLRALGLLDRKGAPETFDAWGYAALLRRLHDEVDHVVHAPAFERDLEQPIAGAIAIDPGVETIVTEGNYLLLDTPAWQAVRAEVDEVWWLDVPDVVRREWLVRRHREFGKSPSDAEAWVTRVDEANAQLVQSTRARADRFIAIR